MSDVISDASLRLAAAIEPLSHKSPRSLRVLTLSLFLVSSIAILLLSGCAGNDGQKDDTDIWSETKLYSEATAKLNDADFAKCGKYFDKL